MINYIYNQLYNLQGWLVRVSDCEELVGVTHRGWWWWSCGQKNSQSISKIVPAWQTSVSALKI